MLNKQVAQHPITIRNPNGSTMRSTHLAELPIPHLPMAARRAHIVPELRSHSLLSIGTTESDDFPEHAERTHDCYVAVHNLDEPTGKIYTDQTGKFPCTSAGGHNYIMVLYDYESNAILMEPVRDRKGNTLLDAHKNYTPDSPMPASVHVSS